MAEISVKLDSSDLQAWAEKLSTDTIARALRNGLNSAAGKARTITIKTLVKDLNIDKGLVLASVGKLVKARPGELRATFTAVKERINILQVKGAGVALKTGLSARQFVLTGGGSSHLQVTRAFIGKGRTSGGKIVFIRRGKSRLPIKAIYAVDPRSALGQEDGASQKIWKSTANNMLPAEVGKRLQQALDRQTITPEIASPD